MNRKVTKAHVLAKIRKAQNNINCILKTLGFKKLQLHIRNKYAAGLVFQLEWSKEFKDNQSKVLEYWKKYRCLDEINSICAIENSMRILDVGCGISTVLHFINGERYGIDPLADEYRKLYNYPKEIKIQKGFGESIPFDDEYFDVVFCSNVLDHVTNPQKTVDEIHRITKKGGYLVLTVEVFEKN